MNRTYSELITIPTFEERFEYLRLDGKVGEDTFGHDRWLNQMLYQRTKEWKAIRRKAIIRDNGCDLGIPGRTISGRILVHHINPITKEDILQRTESILFDLNNLICVSNDTHNAIHYGDASLLIKDYVPRTEFDTCPWRCS